MGIRSINRENAFWHIVQRISLLILVLLILIPMIIYSRYVFQNNMNSSIYKTNTVIADYKKNITKIDAAAVSDQSFQSILDYTTWLKECAKAVNLYIYSSTNNLKMLSNKSQQQLDEYNNKLILDETFSFGGMVKFIIIDKNSGTYITNDTVSFNDNEIKLLSLENGELYNYISSRGKYYYLTYDSSTSPANKYSSESITMPSEYVEAYWFPQKFIFNDTDLTYFNKIKDAIKANITNQISLENTLISNNKNQLKYNLIEIMLLVVIEIILAILLILLGWHRIIAGVKRSFIIRIILWINDSFDRIHTLLKLGILGVSLFPVQLLCFYVSLGRSHNSKVFFITSFIFIFNLVVVLPKLIIFCVQLDKIIAGSKRITSGELEYVIAEKGDKSLSELANNINKINKGFKVSIEEQIANERLKSELVANVSHDLKTPLTSIINYADLLTRENVTNEEKNEYIGILYKKSIKLKHLIEDLFEISKINSGKIKLEKSEVDVVELINQAIVEYSDTDLYYTKNLSFNVKSFEPTIIMSLDGNKLSRVFENLINNALKYSLKGSRVFVDVEKIDAGIRIFFKNTSEVPLDFDKKEILERFTRGDRSRNSEIEGNGLGLAIAKSIVELHDGKLYVDFDGDLFKVIIELKMHP